MSKRRSAEERLLVLAERMFPEGTIDHAVRRHNFKLRASRLLREVKKECAERADAELRTQAEAAELVLGTPQARSIQSSINGVRAAILRRPR